MKSYILVAIVALILVVAYMNTVSEGFVNPVGCGVTLPSCPHGSACMNGFCKTTEVPTLQPTGLPVLPQGYSR